MSDYTPGPWVRVSLHDGWRIETNAAGTIIARLPLQDDTFPNSNANAALIRAAPDLLFALEGVIRAAPDVRDLPSSPLRDALSAARKAIRLAGGEVPA